MSDQYRVYGYRWVVLGAFMFANLAIQMLWISYAPITSESAKYYHVSQTWIGILTMSFMAVFVFLSLPAAWLIDTRGFRVAVGLGVVLMAIAGVARGLAGPHYVLAFAATIGLAVAQPLLLDSWTTVPAKWFAPGERATAVSLVTLASMMGIAVGMVLSPVLEKSMPIARVQLVYGLIAAVAAVTFLVLARERPATAPCPPGMDERALMLDGLRHALRVRPFLIMLVVAFIVMSAFNGVTTWVEEIIKPRGFGSTEAGIMGALMLVAGVIGAVILSSLSDRQGKRVRFMIVALLATVPGMLGVAFASSALTLYVFAAALGFFLVAVLPIGMQYAAEITRPTPEGTSAGLIQLAGQISVVYVYVMEVLRTSNGSFTVSLLLATVLLVACAVTVSRLKDPGAVALAGATAPATSGQAPPETLAESRPEQFAGAVTSPPADRP